MQQSIFCMVYLVKLPFYKETRRHGEMKSKKSLLVITVCLLAAILILNLLMKDLWEVNANNLKKEVLSIDHSVKIINLPDITPFDWDTVYSFDPYTPKDLIYETIGYKWDTVSETVNEGMNQIVFLKEQKVVCYLYGYPANNGFGLFFTSQKGNELASASVLYVEDDLTFDVVRSDSVIQLTNDK